MQPAASENLLGLVEAVLAGGGVEDQQALVRGAGDPFVDHAANLFQFLHQVLGRLQAAGGVDDARRPRRLWPPRRQPAIGHAGRVGCRSAW